MTLESVARRLDHVGDVPASSAAPLLAVVSHQRDCDVITLSGEYDIANEDFLSATVTDAGLSLCDAPVVIDLSGVKFMSASTIHIIERARAYLAMRSRSLTLRSPSPIARRLLDLCGLSSRPG